MCSREKMCGSAMVGEACGCGHGLRVKGRTCETVNAGGKDQKGVHGRL